MRSEALPEWLKSIELFATHSNIIIVPGGGEFADLVRDLQKQLKFDDRVAHRMALLAMCQYGHFLANMSPNLNIIEDIEDISSRLNKNKPLLWLPASLLNDKLEIEASWDFTSDSIALWLATQLAAVKLVLVKSIDLNEVEISIEKHINKGHIDKGFQELRKFYPGEICYFEKGQYEKLTNLA